MSHDENWQRILDDLKERRESMTVGEHVEYIGRLQERVRRSLHRVANEWVH